MHDAGRPADPLHLACPGCGTTNRVPAARLRQRPRCGRCRAALLPGTPVAAGDASFAREVEDSPLPVLVDFWAPWCGPCRGMEPVLEELARRHPARLKVVKVNVDENPDLARRFAVRSIPSLRLWRDGREVDRIDGALGGTALERRLAAHLA